MSETDLEELNVASTLTLFVCLGGLRLATVPIDHPFERTAEGASFKLSRRFRSARLRGWSCVTAKGDWCRPGASRRRERIGAHCAKAVTPADVSDVESVGIDETDSKSFYAWLRLSDGSGAIWTYAINRPVGQAQFLRIVDGF